MKRILFLLPLLLVFSCSDNSKQLTITEDDKQEARKWMDKAMLSYNVGKYQEGVERLNRSIELDSTNWEAYWKRGGCYIMINEYHKAISDFNRAENIKPTANSRLFIQKATIYKHLEKHDSAIVVLEKMLSIYPNNSDGYMHLGSTYGDLGDYREAIRLTAKAIDLNPSNKYALMNYGLLKGETGDFKSACEYLTAAVEKGCSEAEDFASLYCP